MRILWLLLISTLFFSTSAYAQSLNERLAASQMNLRAAMVNLRDIRMQGCKLGRATHCELATLSEIEIALLDLEIRYHQASQRATTEEDADKLKKKKDAAEDARSKVSELADLIK